MIESKRLLFAVAAVSVSGFGCAQLPAAPNPGALQIEAPKTVRTTQQAGNFGNWQSDQQARAGAYTSAGRPPAWLDRATRDRLFQRTFGTTPGSNGQGNARSFGIAAPGWSGRANARSSDAFAIDWSRQGNDGYFGTSARGWGGQGNTSYFGTGF